MCIFTLSYEEPVNNYTNLKSYKPPMNRNSSQFMAKVITDGSESQEMLQSIEWVVSLIQINNSRWDKDYYGRLLTNLLKQTGS